MGSQPSTASTGARSTCIFETISTDEYPNGRRPGREPGPPDNDTPSYSPWTVAGLMLETLIVHNLILTKVFMMRPVEPPSDDGTTSSYETVSTRNAIPAFNGLTAMYLGWLKTVNGWSATVVGSRSASTDEGSATYRFRSCDRTSPPVGVLTDDRWKKLVSSRIRELDETARGYVREMLHWCSLLDMSVEETEMIQRRPPGRPRPPIEFDEFLRDIEASGWAYVAESYAARIGKNATGPGRAAENRSVSKFVTAATLPWNYTGPYEVNCEYVDAIGASIIRRFAFKAIFDTGCSINLLRREAIPDRLYALKPLTKMYNYYGMNRSKITVLGLFEHHVSVDGHTFLLRFHVVPERTMTATAILGREFINEPGVHLCFRNGVPKLDLFRDAHAVNETDKVYFV